MLRKLRQRSLQADDSGLIGIVAVIILLLVCIWAIQSIAAAIIPLAIFLVLAIVLVFIVKKVLYGGKSLGVISGITGFGREAGKETVGLMKGARSEYKHYKEKEEGW